MSASFEVRDSEVNFEIENISAEYIQCQDCSWIGKTEHALMPPGYGGLLSCPACSCCRLRSIQGRERLGPLSWCSQLKAYQRLHLPEG